MRYVTAVIALVTLSCAGTPVSPEVGRIVTLIKAEKYDDLGDPDFLAPACVEALRQLKAEGAEAKRIVAVADFFFEHYPFCVRDLVLDEALFERVAEAHFQASMKLKPALSGCARMSAAKTFMDKARLVSDWHESGHDDGGRCAKDMTEFFRRALKAGPEWHLDPDIGGPVGDERPDLLLGDLAANARGLETSPYLPIMAMVVTRLRDFHTVRRVGSWSTWKYSLSDGRWNRLYESRLLWLEALWHDPEFFGPDIDCVDSFETSRFDPRLRALGAVLRGVSKVDLYPYSASKDLPSVARVAELVVRAGAGTPFPDRYRFAYMVCMLYANRTEEAEAWLRAHEREFDYPLRLAYSWLFLGGAFANSEESSWNPERVLECARKALEAAPGASSAGLSLEYMIEVYQATGRHDQVIPCLEKILALPKNASEPFEDEMYLAVRSRAGERLAYLLLDGREWERSLAAWKAWESYATCGELGDSQHNALIRGVGRCLEELGRHREAADHYWKDVIFEYGSVASAKLLKALHHSRGTTPDLEERVRRHVDAKGMKPTNALKWLADELGVPTQ
jgi:hypothetical protein